MRSSPLYVLEGRVHCPLRGEVDVERCLMCPQFCRMGEADGHDAIWCRGGSRWFDLWTVPRF